MNTYWLSDDETANEFWAHEWNTHGTCINTIEPSCYTDYTDNEEIGDFFQEVVDLFKTLDTYTVVILFFPLLSQSVFGVFLVTHIIYRLCPMLESLLPTMRPTLLPRSRMPLVISTVDTKLLCCVTTITFTRYTTTSMFMAVLLTVPTSLLPLVS